MLPCAPPHPPRMKLLLEKQKQRYAGASFVVEEEAKVRYVWLLLLHTADLRHSKGSWCWYERPIACAGGGLEITN